jgi:hypothetical protein
MNRPHEQLWRALQADRLVGPRYGGAIRQASENAWIESHLERGAPRIETEYNPLDAEHMKK